MALETVIISLSVLFQLASAILALRLIKTTKRRVAWGLVASAITLMALRRVESLLLAISGDPSHTPDLLFETNGLIISVLMLAGIYLIRPIFSALASSREELRSMNAKLSTLTEEQRLLLDHTRDFIYRHDTSGQITYVSPAVERITGFRPEEWLAHYSRYYTDNPVNMNGRKITEEMLRSGADGPTYNVEVKHKDGSTVWLEVNKQPYVVDGKVSGLIGVARDITRRVSLETEQKKLITELQDALASIRTLRGLLPICSSCKKIRDDKGYWNQIEAYVSEHSEAEFSHGLCPECAQKLYPEFHRGT
jgi:PAS domain S-box-containing protein